MNEACREGDTAVQTPKRWFDQSDACHDPQAYVLKPHCCIEIAKAIVAADTTTMPVWPPPAGPSS